MKKVSIIIPCYNAERYIDRCVLSLVNQTIGIDNLELIFVNDASTDHTYEKLCEWEVKYSESIMVINCDENGKQGKARNIGMQYARAEYIGFCDCDDIVERTMFELLYQAALFQKSDLVVCRSKAHALEDVDQVVMGRTADDDFYFTIETLEQREAFLKLDINRAVWNKLYRKEMLIENNLYFPEGMIYEDILFSELVKHYANRVYVLEEALYHHIVDHNSTSWTKNGDERLNYFDVNVLLISELRQRGLYDCFADRYETNFILEFTMIISSYIYMFGYISPDVFDTMSNISLKLFPQMKESAFYQKKVNSDSEGSIRLVLDCVGREITNEDMVNICNAVKKENAEKGDSSNCDSDDVTDKKRIYEYSYLVEMNAKDEDFEQMNQVVLNSKELTLYNRFYYWSQARRMLLRKKELCDSKQLLNQIYTGIQKEYEEACLDLLTPIRCKDRNPDLIYVITLQFIGLDHPPTRTALERIKVLNHDLKKTVKAINTCEPMTSLGKFPLYVAQESSVNEGITGNRTYQYDGFIFSLAQSSKDMPEIGEVRRMLQEIREDKPYMILVIGNGSIVADMASKIIPVINIPVAFSSVWIREGQYTAVGRHFSDEEKRQYFGKTELPVNIIESTFSFQLKEQKNHYSRIDFGLPEDKFLLVVVGTRLHDEVDDEFIVEMMPLLSQNAFFVFAGKFDNYEMYCDKYSEFAINSSFIGYQDDIMAVNELMDLYVNPKRLGGGYSIIEAFSKGVPGVTLQTGDIAVAAGEAFCVGDYAQMRNVILRYMTDQSFYKEQMQKALQRVQEVTDATAALRHILQEAESRELFF